MIDWVVTTMRNVEIALETANLNGFVYDTSFPSHHKKPGTFVMQRDLKKVGGGGKTAQKPTSAAASLLCNICGCLLPEGFYRYESRRIGQMKR
jgi:hypothetical protein